MEIFEKYLEDIEKDESKKCDFKEFLCKLFTKMKSHDPHHYHKRMCDLHKIVYGEHFNEEIACKAVSAMCNSDGTSGAHWSLSDTTNFANRYNLNKYDFYYVMNMLYSDFSTALNTKDAELFARLANAYITDKDAPEGKAFRVYMSAKY